MSTLTNYLSGIANAIRNKKGNTDSMINAKNFADEINSLQSVTLLDIYPMGSGATISFDIASKYFDYTQLTIDNIVAMPVEGLYFANTADTKTFTWEYDASTGALNLTSSSNFSANTKKYSWKIAIIQ